MWISTGIPAPSSTLVDCVSFKGIQSIPAQCPVEELIFDILYSSLGDVDDFPVAEEDGAVFDFLDEEAVDQEGLVADDEAVVLKVRGIAFHL